MSTQIPPGSAPIAEEDTMRAAVGTASWLRWLAVLLLGTIAWSFAASLTPPLWRGIPGRAIRAVILTLWIVLAYGLPRWWVEYRTFARDRPQMQRSRRLVRDAFVMWLASPVILVVVLEVWARLRS